MANRVRYFEPPLKHVSGFDLTGITLREQSSEAVIYYRHKDRNETLVVRGPQAELKDEKGNVTRAAFAGGAPFIDDETGGKALAAVAAFLEKGVTP